MCDRIGSSKCYHKGCLGGDVDVRATGYALGISVMNVAHGRIFCVQSAQTLTAELIPLVKLLM